MEKGEEQAIEELVNSVNTWLRRQAVEDEQQEDGTVKTRMGSKAKDLLSKIKSGDNAAIKRVKQNISSH